MRLDRFTIKAQEALQSAQTLAGEAQNPELGVEHLMLSLIKQTDGVVTPIFQKLGADIQEITSALENVVQMAPKVQGVSSELHISRSLQSVLETALKEATTLKDEYVSTEHLLIACAESKQSEVVQILWDAGVTKDKILKAGWQNEKANLIQIRELMEQIEAFRIESEQAKRSGNLASASELEYGKIPALEAQLKTLREAVETDDNSTHMLKEHVSAEDIAEIVAKWTGIPVFRLMEGEHKNCFTWKSGYANRSSGRMRRFQLFPMQFGVLVLVSATRSSSRFILVYGTYWRRQNTSG